jgi:hypothetical protein
MARSGTARNPRSSFRRPEPRADVGGPPRTIVVATTTDIRPDQGHIDLSVDNHLVSMNYGFVASDHVPFDPRVVTPDVVSTVQP